MKNLLFTLICFCFVCINTKKSFSQNEEANIKVAYIYNFVQNIDCLENSTEEEFVIGYYGADEAILKSLNNLAETKQIKEKKVKIIQYNNLNLIQAPFPQALFSDAANNKDIVFLNKKIQDKNVLLITDKISNQKLVMLNFTYNIDNELSFEINKKTIGEHNFKILPKLMLLGGSEIDIRNLYKETEEELNKEKMRVEAQRKELKQQKEELERQKYEITILNSEIQEKQAELKKQTENLQKLIEDSKRQNEKFALIKKDVSEKERLLNKRNEDISKQQKLIKEIKKTVGEEKNKLAELDNEIIVKEELIKTKEFELFQKELLLGQKDSTINQQQNWLFGIITVLIIILTMSFLLIKSYRAIKKANKKIATQKIEVQEKNEELIAADEELRQNNEELKTLNENLRRQHEIIQEKDKKYRILFENSNDAISVIDDGKFIDCNNAMVEMFGYNKKTEFINTEPYKLSPEFQPDDRESKEKASEVIETALNKGVNKFEWVHKRADGSEFPAEVWLTAVQLKNDDVIHTVIRDLTEQKKAELALQKSRDEIKEAHQHITESINYAKTIQDALLTDEEIINKWLNDYFILFKPKDRVSGDFYYVNKVNKYLIVVAADCTGHGVPGGFLTMLGITFLHEAVKHKHVNTANQVLEILRQRVKETFSSFGGENSSGLDIALCVIDTETNMMQYSGAYNPLIIIRNNEIIHYKATRSPIGNYPKEKKFENHEIQLYKDDAFYIFSDGYVDQYGGESRKKFSLKRFKELLLEYHKLPMSRQKELLDNNLIQWQSTYHQIDDIIVLGIKWELGMN